MNNYREVFQILTRRFGLLNKNCCSIGGVEISLVQSHILYEIDRHTNPSMQIIAESLAIDITTFSRQIQTLGKMGLVLKQRNPEDRRVYTLSLTTEGKFVATSIDKDMNQYLEEVFSHMSEIEQETVFQSIKLLNECMSRSTVCCKPII